MILFAMKQPPTYGSTNHQLKSSVRENYSGMDMYLDILAPCRTPSDRVSLLGNVNKAALLDAIFFHACTVHRRLFWSKMFLTLTLTWTLTLTETLGWEQLLGRNKRGRNSPTGRGWVRERWRYPYCAGHKIGVLLVLPDLSCSASYTEDHFLLIERLMPNTNPNLLLFEFLAPRWSGLVFT